MRKTACYFHARCRVDLFNLQNGSQKEIADREAEAAASFHAPVGRVVFFSTGVEIAVEKIRGVLGMGFYIFTLQVFL